MTDAGDDDLLHVLNAKEAREHVGGVVFVTILMVLGIIGNVHVLVVYAFRMKPSNHRIFILVLAAIDFTTCVVGMPFILVDLRHPLTFTLTAACKILRFINYFIASSSFMLMVVIAAERYRKICVPFGRQVSRTAAKGLCLLVLCIACLMSWPAPVLFGHSSVHIPEYNITGSKCDNEDRFKGTKYMAYFNIGLILIFITAFVTLVVLYFLIWRVILKHAPTERENSEKDKSSTQTSDTQEKQQLTSSGTSPSTEMVSDPGSMSKTASKENENPQTSIELKTVIPESNVQDAEVSTKTDQNGSKNGEVTIDEESGTLPKPEKRKNLDSNLGANISHKKVAKKFDAARRTTFIFILIATLMFLSYFPHLVLKIVNFLNAGFLESLSYTGRIFYKTFIWCFFINNMANPFVYGFYDKHFMAEVKVLYRKIPSLLCRR